MNTPSKRHYLRMQAPVLPSGDKVLAFVADGMASGYALIDQGQDSGLLTPFVVTLIIQKEDGSFLRQSGRYFEDYFAAMYVFAERVKSISEDELRSAAAFAKH